MKLFIWSYYISYGAAVIFAVAENEDDARKAVAEGKAFCGSSNWGHMESSNPGYAHDGVWTTSDLARALGKPDRIIDLTNQTYAEWHQWSE